MPKASFYSEEKDFTLNAVFIEEKTSNGDKSLPS
jgi:hypothetical protein